MTEPLPGPPREEIWRRDGDSIVVYVNERGIVECSCELVALLLAETDWERD